jgi:hypothetical protein
MPTYRIDGPGLELPRVVVAALPAQAIAHVVNDSFKARRIEVDEAFALAEQGVKLERLGETPTPAVEPEPEGDGAEFEEVHDADPEARPMSEPHPLGQQLGDSHGQQFHGEGSPFDAGDEELEGN